MSTETQVKKSLVWLRRLGRFIIGLGKVKLTLLLLVGLVLLALQYPWVQTRLAGRATAWLSERTGFAVSIERVSIRWLDAAVLQGVRIIDQQGQPMILAEEIAVDYDLLALLDGKDIVLNRARLTRTEVNLIFNSPDSSLNIEAFISKLSGPPSGDTAKAVQKFIIDQALLDHVQFSMHKPYADSIPPGQFDYNHFILDSIHGEIEGFWARNDTIALSAKQLLGFERRAHWPIHELTTEFLYCRHQMRFGQLLAKVGQSTLRDSLSLNYHDPVAFADFNHQVTLGARLTNSVVHTDDLALFAPSLRLYNQSLAVSGQITGPVARLRARNAELAFGNTRLAGNFGFDGLPQIDETLLVLKFRPSVLDPDDLRPILGDTLTNYLQKFGRVDFKGEFDGFTYDFAAKGTLQTALGTLMPDLRLELEQKRYSGTLGLRNFALGQLLEQPALGLVDLNARVQEGRGFDLKTAEVLCEANIARLGLRGYDYHNLTFKGNVRQGLVDGELDVQDPNLTLGFFGKVDLNTNTIEANVAITNAFLKPLGFSAQEAQVRGEASMNFSGLTLDELQGEIEFDSLYFAYGSKDVLFPSLLLHSSIEPNNRRDFYLQSDMLDVEAEGNFKPSRILQDIGLLYEEYMLDLVNDDAAIAQYYQKKQATKNWRRTDWAATAYQLDYQIKLKDLNPLVQVFVPDLYLSKRAVLAGQFKRDTLSRFTLRSYGLDTLRYARYAFYQNQIEYTTTKRPQMDSISAFLQISSGSAALRNSKLDPAQPDALSLEGLKVEGDWHGEEIGYKFYVKQKDAADYADLRGNFRLLPGQHFQFNLFPSRLRVLNEDWANPDTARVDAYGREVTFQNFTAQQGQRRVEVRGQLSEDPAKTLGIHVGEFNLGVFSNLLGYKLTGTVDVNATLQNVYRDLQINGMANADSITLGGFLIGDLRSRVAWIAEQKQLDLQANLERQGEQLVAIEGSYAAARRRPLDLTARLIKADVNMIEPFLGSIASGFAGQAEGEVKIRGPLDELGLKGEIFVRGGAFIVNYLGARYFFDDKIYFDDDYIGMRRLRLRDDQKASAFIDGGIYHSGFTNFLLQLNGDFKNFKVLDTKLSEEALYYGTAVATGDFAIFGPTNRLNILVNATANKGTMMFLPLDGYASAQTQSFIRYTSFRPDSTGAAAPATQAGVKPVEISSLGMDMKLNITPDADFQIIFDKKSGDIIRGNARGLMDLKIDTRGSFDMTGEVEIVKGAYNFTFQNLFNKEFAITPGSRLTWSGDPYKGQLNITAVYDQRVSYAPILSQQLRNQQNNSNNNGGSAELNRRYPSRVNLGVTGELLSPNVKFGIDLYDYPRNIVVDNRNINLETEVSAFKARLAADEQEMNRQVFSLILLKRLFGTNDAVFQNTGQSAGGSVSELLANQLSSWISQVDENLEVDINLNGLDASALNTMQLRLSYSLLNGRVRITRDGAFTSANNQANASSIAGDWTLEYLVTRDGKLRMKIYRRTNTNTFNAAIAGNTITGASIQFTKSFNSWSELIGFKRKRKSERKDNRRRNIPARNHDDEIIFEP